MNEQLRTALLQRGVSVDQLAAECGVDPKTAGRWIVSGRTPHPRHRRSAAKLLNVQEHDLWPEIREKQSYLSANSAPIEVIRTYPDRATVPRNVWLQLLNSASASVDILVFSGTFLAQTNPRIADMLLVRAAAGVQVRLCFGAPSGEAVARRDAEEGLGGTLGAKIRASLSYFTKLIGDQNCDIRLHDTTLYASLFRYDDEALINPHIWGRPASSNPIIHVRHTNEDDMFSKYLESFGWIWREATPWLPDESGLSQ